MLELPFEGGCQSGACSTAVFVSNPLRKRLRTLFVGPLDRAQDVEVDAHIWTCRKLPWVELPDHHRVFPRAGDWRPDYASDPTRLEAGA